jgi:periplasmic protein TonB
VVPPRPLSEAAGNRPPAYPDSAKQRGEQGRALLRVEVTADGRAAAVSVLRSTGFARLDQSAVEAVRGWRFLPATRGGRPIAATAEVPVNFELSSD